MLKIGDKVMVTGNCSQGIRHFNSIGVVGFIESVRRGMVIRRTHKAVDAYRVNTGNGGGFIVAKEDLTKIE